MLELARKAIARETSPITDIRATAGYRAHMLEVMLERGIRAAVSRLNGERARVRDEPHLGTVGHEPAPAPRSER